MNGNTTRHEAIMNPLKKRVVFASIVFLVSSLMLLSPHRTGQIGAIPSNLWTYGGEWSNPSPADEILHYNRIQYGAHWGWLTYDSEINGPSWYAKITWYVLFIYLGLSVLLGIITASFCGKKR